MQHQQRQQQRRDERMTQHVSAKHTHRTINPFLSWSKELDKDSLSGRQFVKVLIGELDRGGSGRVDTEQRQLKQYKKQRHRRFAGRHCCQSKKGKTILNQHVGSHRSNKTETRVFGKMVVFLLLLLMLCTTVVP